MVTGPFINAAAVLIGGIAGAGLSHRLPERIRTSMPSVFGLASLAIGVLLIIKCANMPVMVLSVLLGAVIGELCCLENKINAVAGKIKTRLSGLSFWGCEQICIYSGDDSPEKPSAAPKQ